MSEEELRKIADEETMKQIMVSLDGSIISTYIQKLKEINLKKDKRIEELQYLENSNWQQYANLKKKIKDKIEELENIKLCADKFFEWQTENKIKLLKELLDKENV